MLANWWDRLRRSCFHIYINLLTDICVFISNYLVILAPISIPAGHSWQS